MDASILQDNELRQAELSRAAQTGAAGSGTLSHGIATDHDLAHLIDVWPNLPALIRVAILALVHSSTNALCSAPDASGDVQSR
jgi:hypothetical protein